MTLLTIQHPIGLVAVDRDPDSGQILSYPADPAPLGGRAVCALLDADGSVYFVEDGFPCDEVEAGEWAEPMRSALLVAVETGVAS